MTVIPIFCQILKKLRKNNFGTDSGLNPLRTGFVFSKLLFNLSLKSRTRKKNTGKVEMFLESCVYILPVSTSPLMTLSSKIFHFKIGNPPSCALTCCLFSSNS